jgi:hypothetical protein
MYKKNSGKGLSGTESSFVVHRLHRLSLVLIAGSLSYSICMCLLEWVDLVQYRPKSKILLAWVFNI